MVENLSITLSNERLEMEKHEAVELVSALIAASRENFNISLTTKRDAFHKEFAAAMAILFKLTRGIVSEADLEYALASKLLKDLA
jgi:hypothetical protein